MAGMFCFGLENDKKDSFLPAFLQAAVFVEWDGEMGEYICRKETYQVRKLKFIHFLERHLTGILAAVFLTVFLFSVFRYTGLDAAGRSVHIGKERPVVVIDAGHGRGRMRKRGAQRKTQGEKRQAVKEEQKI